MMIASGRLLFVALLALAVAGCAPDAAIKPNVVSYNNQGSMAAGAPSTTATPQQTKGRYFIEFRSRYALTYGHTYVIFGRVDQAGQMIDREVAGLAPASNSAVPYVLGHYIPVP